MGVFARNRTQLSEIEIGYDLNYTCENDALSMIIDSYINESHVLETLMQRDMLESIDVLSEEKDSNILITLWEGFLNIIKGIREKINGIVDGICDAIDNFKSDFYDSTIKKTESEFDKADLSGLSINNLTLFNYDEFLKCKDIDNILSKVKSLDINKFKGESIDVITLQKNKDFAVYDNLKSSIHDLLWYKTKSKYPFKEKSDLKQIIKSILRENSKENRTIKRTRREIFDHLKSQEIIAKKMLASAHLKRTKDKSEKEYNIAFAKECNSIINEAQRVTAGVINTILSEYKKIVAVCSKLYTAGSKYAVKQSSGKGKKSSKNKLGESYIDIDYLTAIAEATEYEFELYTEDLIAHENIVDYIKYN